MPLEETVDNLEGVDERYRDLYVEQDGKFVVDITGLKSALTKERASNKKRERELNKLKKQDVSPDEEFETMKKQLVEKDARLSKMVITDKVKSAALEAGIDKNNINDVLVLTSDRFKLDDDGGVVVVDELGEPTGMTPATFFSNTYKRAKPMYYEGSGQTGSGAMPNLGAGGLMSDEKMKDKILSDIREGKGGSVIDFIKIEQKKLNL